MTTGKEVWHLPVRHADDSRAEVACAAFSPDGRALAVGLYGSGEIRVYEHATGQERRRFPGHRDAALCLAFSPDGRTLASGSADGTALLWDLWGLKDAPRQAEVAALWEQLAST